MFEEFARAWDQLASRFGGPLSFRFLIQPLMAVTLAIRAGARDARAHRPPFLWSVLTEPGQRHALIVGGWRDISTLFAVAVLIDTAYQLWVLHFFYPLQVLIVAGALAVVPYAAVRGLVTRALSRRRTKTVR